MYIISVMIFTYGLSIPLFLGEHQEVVEEEEEDILFGRPGFAGLPEGENVEGVVGDHRQRTFLDEVTRPRDQRDLLQEQRQVISTAELTTHELEWLEHWGRRAELEL